MNLTDTFLKQLVDWGPIIASVVGSILTFLASIFAFVARWAWTKHCERMSLMEGAIARLTTEIASATDKQREEHVKIWDMAQQLRAEVHMAKNSTDHLKAGLLSVEGVIKHQQGNINEHIGVLAKLDAKLEAVFRFVDANKRATDVTKLRT